MIQLQNISVIFGKNTPLETTVVHNLSLNIQKKEFVTIIGGNGAGKSTLLNTIAGDIIPQNGYILIDNINVTKLPTHKRAQFVSRVFQDPLQGTCAHFTIEENLLLAQQRGEIRSLRLAHQRELIANFQHRLAELNLGLENRLNSQMGMLSGGQRQAVSLVMATLKAPKILLLDEHTAALDPKMAETIMMLTNRIIQEEKITTLMITHSMHQALDFGSRTLLLQQGKIIKDLPADQRKVLTAQDLLEFFG